jgi:hypothetical protein
MPKSMLQLRCIFLLAILLAVSGYKFRCWWMCQDQTAIQNDYVEQRDRCRQYSQLKLDMAMRNSNMANNGQNRKTMLISLFSDCMAQNGWSTTDVKAPGATVTPLASGKPASPHAAPTGPAPVDTNAAQTAADQRAALSRAAECAFARQAASASGLAATRAKACDLECAQRLRMAPDAPRPAACPAGPVEGLQGNAERTY